MIQSLNDEILIYSYMIHYGNFDNQMPIPEFLSSIIQEKPSEDYYRKHDSIERKILVLQENGYIYDIQHLISAMQLQARTNATKISSINRSFINDELIEKVSQYLELPLRDILAAALIPALLHYFGIFVIVSLILIYIFNFEQGLVYKVFQNINDIHKKKSYLFIIPYKKKCASIIDRYLWY